MKNVRVGTLPLRVHFFFFGSRLHKTGNYQFRECNFTENDIKKRIFILSSVEYVRLEVALNLGFSILSLMYLCMECTLGYIEIKVKDKGHRYYKYTALEYGES